eukprot:SAG11_NODE_7790_length_1096_cov_1.036108_1_plen_111_part_01
MGFFSMELTPLSAALCVSLSTLTADARLNGGAGFWFSLGHSTVVVLLCAGVAFGSSYLRGYLDRVKSVGAIVGTSVSASVLLLVAGMNTFVAWGLVARWRELRARRRAEQE